jgi:hypothetical protein
MFIESDPFGFRGVGFQGAEFYTADNPPVGAVFTYFLKDEVKSLKDKRVEKEKELQKKNEEVKFPDYNTLRKEQEEPDPFLLFTITDESGNVIKKIKKGISKGLNRVVWDFRFDSPRPISLKDFDSSIPWNEPDKGYMAVPGKYYVSMSRFVDGVFSKMVPPQEFTCKPLGNATLPAEDKNALYQFNKKVAELTRAISGADSYRKELNDKLSYLKKAVFEAPKVDPELYAKILQLELDLAEFNRKLNGDGLKSNYQGGVPSAVKDRVDLITYGLWTTTAAPTGTYFKSYDAAASQFDDLLLELRSIDDKVKNFESMLEKSGAQFTPGRFPEWNK